MSKTKKIIYWVATIWLSLGMTVSAVLQLSGMKEGVEAIVSLGYPEYLLIVLGVWKILGVIAILVPKYPLVKEWAYAGFFFVATGALYSHIAAGHPASEWLGITLFLILIGASWYLRPEGRKVSLVN